MPTNHVTAQDIYNVFRMECGTQELEEFEINALLSQARQESRRESLKEMDEAYSVIEIMCDADWKGQEKFNEAMARLRKLRQEYQQPN